MKVLMFGWEFPPHITGGLGTACYGLTKGLLNHDVEVTFVVPKAFGDEYGENMRIISASDIPIDIHQQSFQEFWKQITYIEVGSNMIPYASPEGFENIILENKVDSLSSLSRIFSKNFTFSGKYSDDLYEEVSRYALVAGAIAQSNNFDLIHAHDWLTYPAGIAVKKITSKPLIVHVHATEFDRSGENINQYVFDIEQRGMQEADRVITVSDRTRDVVINRYNINPDKVFTIHNAVEHNDNTLFNPNTRPFKEKIVTFLGRVTFQKGPDYFVEAANLVLKKDKNIRFVMAGEGDMLLRMIRRVAQLRIASNFHFTGFLKGDDIDKLFSMSDVYVMPSVSEPFGISPLEAMKSSVPVIISRQSGVSEVLNYALKVDFWDIFSIADAIYGLVHYDALSKMFRRLGKIEVENLKWDNVAFKIKEIYNGCI